MRWLFKRRFIRKYFFALLVTVVIYWLIKTIALTRTSYRFVFVNNSIGDTHDYIINTSGCKIPKLDPFHSSISHFIERLSDLDCDWQASKQLVYLEDNVICLLPDLNSSQINCTLKTISQKTDNENDIGEQQVIPDNGSVVTSEFSHVECTNTGEDKIIYNGFYPRIVRKQNVEKRIEAYFRKQTKKENKTPLSVILLGLDSVSKNQFVRHLVKTRAFMDTNLNYIELHGYNKIGPNTYANMVPMFTGKLESEVPDTSEVPVDALPLIWKDYMKNGYRTQFSEDFPEGSIFNYARKGFNATPVDYYLRPFSLAVEPHIGSWTTGCLNNVTEASVIFKWMQDFMDFFRGDPLFAFTFLTRMSHDYLNYLSYHDVPIYNFLDYLYTRGHFNNTVMFFFGDHGFRFGDFRSTYIGRMEGRLPFMFIIFPSWFPKMYPQLYNTLKINEKRLTTPLDIYATLKDLLDFKGESTPQEGDGRSISLMRFQVPDHRTCRDSHIKSQWCSCFELEPVLVNDTNVVRCAANIVNKINHITAGSRKQCAKLNLLRVLSASTRVIGMGDLATAESSPQGTLTNYLVTFQVEPSNGIFEGSIWYDGESVYTVEGTIERINLYGNQSACVDVNFLKPYCYCTNAEQPEKP